MTHLQRVSVEGFKAIDSLEFEPGAINVVTGRNNSGKTSLLEAIDLGLQPSNIEKFGEDLDTVIHQRYEESRISVNAGENVNELLLSKPPKREAINRITTATRAALIESWEMLATDDMSRDEVIEIIDEELSKFFTEIVDDGKIDRAAGQVIKLESDNVEHSFIQPTNTTLEIYVLSHKFIQFLLGEGHDSNYSDEALQEDWLREAEILPLNHTFDGISGFLEGDPTELGTSKFIDFVQLSKSLDLEADEDEPIKIDDIGDFLREKEIVDNLKTFDLDHLIFEEDGEKYSVPFDHMGEGFKTLVGILWQLFDVEGTADVVLLEEPNTHMHPGYVRQLIYFLVDLAREEDLQLFITTHNNDFLNDFFTENIQHRDGDFLEEEFRLVQMHDGAADVMTYEEAEKQLKDLHLDLRGI